MPAKKKPAGGPKKTSEEVVAEVVLQLDRAVRRLEEAVGKVDRLASERINQLDEKATGKIGEVETSALNVVSETARSAGKVIDETRGSVESVMRRASREAQTVVDRVQTVIWIAVGSAAYLVLFAFVLFWIDRAEDQKTFSEERVVVFTMLIFVALPVLFWVVSSAVRAVRNARLPHSEREQRFDGDVRFIDYMFGFTYSRERVNNVFAVLSILGAVLAGLILVLLYVRPVL